MNYLVKRNGMGLFLIIIIFLSTSFNVDNRIIVDTYYVFDHKHTKYSFINDGGELDGYDIYVIDDSKIGNLGFYMRGVKDGYQYNLFEGELNFSHHYSQGHFNGYSFFYPPDEILRSEILSNTNKKVLFKTIRSFKNDSLIWAKEIYITDIDTIKIN